MAKPGLLDKRCAPAPWLKLQLLLFALLVTSQARAWNGDFPAVLERIKGSVVAVGSWAPQRTPPSVFLGTGFFVSGDGVLATNYHVIEPIISDAGQGALSVFLKSGDRVQRFAALVIKKDPFHDLALLRINYPSRPMAIAQAPAREGQLFAYTGFPASNALGLFHVTHRAMVSSITPVSVPVNRASQLSAKSINYLSRPYYVYQLDGTAYPGNSGSPLYDMQTGEVVGILNRVYLKGVKENLLAQPSGISYAVPAHFLESLLHE